MNEIININEKITMTSLEIAEFTCKRHSDVLRDIEDEQSKITRITTERIFALSKYQDSTGRNLPMYILTKKGVMQLGARYDAKIRYVLISKLEEMEHTARYKGLPNFSNPAEAARAWADEIDKNRALENKIEIDRPKVVLAEAITASKTSILISDFAKILKQNGVNIGGKRLFEKLRRSGYLVKSGSGRNSPTQKAMELGLFEINETPVTLSNNDVIICKTSKITGKGQEYFLNRYL